MSTFENPKDLDEMLADMTDGINPANDILAMLPDEEREEFIQDPTNQFNGNAHSTLNGESFHNLNPEMIAIHLESLGATIFEVRERLDEVDTLEYLDVDQLDS